MTNQNNGLVLTAKDEKEVELSVFTGDDAQFWIWDKEIGVIESKVQILFYFVFMCFSFS